MENCKSTLVDDELIVGSTDEKLVLCERETNVGKLYTI
jgi:hypothetical protein